MHGVPRTRQVSERRAKQVEELERQVTATWESSCRLDRPFDRSVSPSGNAPSDPAAATEDIFKNSISRVSPSQSGRHSGVGQYEKSSQTSIGPTTVSLGCQTGEEHPAFATPFLLSPTKDNDSATPLVVKSVGALELVDVDDTVLPDITGPKSGADVGGLVAISPNPRSSRQTSRQPLIRDAPQLPKLALATPTISLASVPLRPHSRSTPRTQLLTGEGPRVAALQSELDLAAEEHRHQIQAMHELASEAQEKLRAEFNRLLVEQRQKHEEERRSLRLEIMQLQRDRQRFGMLSGAASETGRATSSHHQYGMLQSPLLSPTRGLSDTDVMDDRATSLFPRSTAARTIATQAPDLPSEDENPLARTELRSALTSLFSKKDDIVELMGAHSHLKEVMRNSEEARNLLRYGKIPVPPVMGKLPPPARTPNTSRLHRESHTPRHRRRKS